MTRTPLLREKYLQDNMRLFRLKAKQSGVFDKTTYQKGEYCSNIPVRGSQATNNRNQAFLIGTHFSDIQHELKHMWRELSSFFDFEEISTG
jgi:hypothetical protein